MIIVADYVGRNNIVDLFHFPQINIVRCNSHSRYSGLFRSIDPGREGDTSWMDPVPGIPIWLPNQPGPSIIFMLRKKTINAAKTKVKALMPSNCIQRFHERKTIR